ILIRMLGIKSLPEGLRNLSNLQHLSIRECSALEEECREGVGSDWPKIAHIPHTYVGNLNPVGHCPQGAAQFSY
ncbi:NBS-LRR resistance protein, partial [Trifolium medium]|nr:NBS-LRR resistance protein [Trifolium medium]